MPKRSTPPTLMVVFGASGDLSRRKLIPSLYSLAKQKLLPAGFTLLGYARTHYSDDDFRKLALESLREYASDGFDEAVWEEFARGLFYQAGAYDDQASFQALRQRVADLDSARNAEGNHLFYLATPPNVFKPIATHLDGAGLAKSTAGGWTRIIIEKPFGHDLESAQDLNEHLLHIFGEEQIYRIDHYLGKETVQNILVFRFGNGIFEPIWNRNFIDHVQITVAETLDIGERGGYYDKSGTLRDMVQNHMMQLVALTAMEPPVAFDPKSVRDQKVNTLRSIRPLDPLAVDRWAVRAQYGGGIVNGKKIQSYLLVDEVAADSITDTFVAWKLEIDNWRWNGVPFYLRTGKALAEKVTEVHIVFRKPPLMLFEQIGENLKVPSNVLTLRIQPDESIYLSFDAKRPGPQVELDRVRMQFSYSQSFGAKSADAYERLLLDALLGDGTLFIRRDEIEVAWDRVSRVLEGWKIQKEDADRQGRMLRLPQYAPGSWGPREADDLLQRDGRHWRSI
jgi:glucose-6-phosphate 1-dehydrogenase